MQIWVDAPPEVQEYIKNESFSRSDNICCGEGGDYITETENKHIKGHISPGVPSTAHQWIKASRNHEMLQWNCCTAFEKSSLKAIQIFNKDLYLNLTMKYKHFDIWFVTQEFLLNLMMRSH